MHDNPYTAVLRRYFLLALYSANAVLFSYISLSGLFSGKAYGIWWSSRLYGEPFLASANPSQFWLLILLYSAGSIVFAVLAWQEYNNK